MYFPIDSPKSNDTENMFRNFLVLKVVSVEEFDPDNLNIKVAKYSDIDGGKVYKKYFLTYSGSRFVIKIPNCIRIKYGILEASVSCTGKLKEVINGINQFLFDNTENLEHIFETSNLNVSSLQKNSCLTVSYPLFPEFCGEKCVQFGRIKVRRNKLVIDKLLR